MRRQEFTYAGTRDAGGITPTLHGCIYYPDADVKIRAVVQFVHGMDEHFGRYTALAEALTENGIVLVGVDHRGHGRSVAAGGVFGSFSAYDGGWRLVLSDLFRLARKMKTMFPETPYFLLGHSMGSFLIRAMLAVQPELADGAILSGTAYHDAAALETGRELCRAVIAKSGRETPMNAFMGASDVLYNLHFHPIKTDFDWVSGDAATVQARYDDPYCGHTPTAGLFYDMFGGLLAVCAGCALNKPKAERAKYKAPVLFVSGKQDPVGDYGRGVWKTAALFRYLGCPSVTVKLYSDARHEVLLDLCRGEVYETITNWILNLTDKKTEPTINKSRGK